MQGERLHEAVQTLLRSYLHGEAARGDASPLAPFFKKFSTVHREHYIRELERKRTDMPNAEDRFART